MLPEQLHIKSLFGKHSTYHEANNRQVQLARNMHIDSLLQCICSDVV